MTSQRTEGSWSVLGAISLLVSSTLTTEQIKSGLDKGLQLKDLVENAETVSFPA